MSRLPVSRLPALLTATDPDLLWKQYSVQIDLYKFYLELALKATAFFYGITGGILAYYFKNSTTPLIAFSLLLPVVMSFSLAGMFVFGAVTMRHARYEVVVIRDRLGFLTAPDLGVLSLALAVLAGIAIIVGISIAVLFAAQYRFLQGLS